MSDTIYRQAAIDALGERPLVWTNSDYEVARENQWDTDKRAIENVPSAQPERLTDDDFETIRIHLNAYKEKLCNQQRWEEAEEYQRIIDRFMGFASAQPYSLDEWCDTCKEYDSERHCCPRYNRVIRDAMKMRKRGKWERLSIRPNVYGDLRWYCSSCGYSTLDDWASTWSYCPHCGADMREGGEDDS